MDAYGAIKHYKTPVNEDGQYREYMVFKQDGKFVTQCIGWQIKSQTRHGGSRDYYQEFDTEEDAVAMYDDLVKHWEAENQ